jgi:DNA-directed RNA polymerase beta subunit
LDSSSLLLEKAHWQVFIAFLFLNQSLRCRIHGLKQEELVAVHEERHEMGGYFIVNGLEKIIRLLIATRRNEVMGIVRPSFKKKGPGYTHFGTQIRCVRADQSSQTMTVHYISDGSITARLIMGKQEFFIPAIVLLKVCLQKRFLLFFFFLFDEGILIFLLFLFFGC